MFTKFKSDDCYTSLSDGLPENVTYVDSVLTLIIRCFNGYIEPFIIVFNKFYLQYYNLCLILLTQSVIQLV